MKFIRGVIHGFTLGICVGYLIRNGYNPYPIAIIALTSIVIVIETFYNNKTN